MLYISMQKDDEANTIIISIALVHGVKGVFDVHIHKSRPGAITPN